MVEHNHSTAPKAEISSKQLIATACIAAGISITGGFVYYLLTRKPQTAMHTRRSKKHVKAALVDTDDDFETEAPKPQIKVKTPKQVQISIPKLTEDDLKNDLELVLDSDEITYDAEGLLCYRDYATIWKLIKKYLEPRVLEATLPIIQKRR